LAEELKEDLQINETHQSKEEPIAEYAYENLVDRFYARLDQMRTGQEVANKITMEPPKVGRQSIRCGWLNFASNCKSLKRDQKHVMKFVLSELGATGSLGGDNKLVINGRYQAKHIETVLTKYARK
jgi:translation initiation factor 2 subunit 2